MKIVITGGCGFIGSNAARRYLEAGHSVVLIDNLVKNTSELNLKWLQTIGIIDFVRADVRDFQLLKAIFERHGDIDLVLHLAAQAAVTSSLIDPRLDFEVNALGTLNILEILRLLGIDAVFLFASTNKVYGSLAGIPIFQQNGAYCFPTLPFGISENCPVEPCTPYGCSKAAADQYVHDYHSTFGLHTIVFRQSCIYGPRQFGCEDQGWVAWLMAASLLGHPITFFGDGCQTRDLLFIEDLLDAFDAAFAAGRRIAGRIYNIGGGPSNTASLRSLMASIEKCHEPRSASGWASSNWRPGDQKVFVSDVRKANCDFGWAPKTKCDVGFSILFPWVASHLKEFSPA
jgi:CDP-paratose 2-epimerase